MLLVSLLEPYSFEFFDFVFDEFVGKFSEEFDFAVDFAVFGPEAEFEEGGAEDVGVGFVGLVVDFVDEVEEEGGGVLGVDLKVGDVAAEEEVDHDVGEDFLELGEDVHFRAPSIDLFIFPLLLFNILKVLSVEFVKNLVYRPHNMRYQRMQELKMKSRRNNPSLLLPLLPFTKRHPFPYHPLHILYRLPKLPIIPRTHIKILL